MHSLRAALAASLVLAGLASGGATVAAAPDARFDGRPVFGEGFDLGYYIWRDGDEWHVRWTTRGRTHLFSGQVTAEGGDLEDLDRVDLERESRLVRTGSRPVLVRGPRGRLHYERRPTASVVTRAEDVVERVGDRIIRFQAKTDADIDGFDFEVDDDVHTLRFLLQIDGQTRPVAVEAGRHNARIADAPLVVRLR
ncbi:MAG: hypothetical protein AB1635_13520 [Acidobacteriota bacterium]